MIRRLAWSSVLAGLGIWAITGGAQLGQASDRIDRIQEQYCSMKMSDFQDRAFDPSQRLAFQNYGGLFNGGVCWWHSKFQRLAFYLTQFDPSAPKPSSDEAKRIIDRIVKASAPVRIPGYRNLNDFSRDYEALIEKKLEGWQKKDGIFNFAWIRGLKGNVSRDPEKFRADLDVAYRKLHDDGELVYAKLQIPGIDSHAWLIIGMTKTADGYDIQYIDSNAPDATLTHHYKLGDAQVEVEGFGPAGLYPQYDSQTKKIRKAMTKYCKGVEVREAEASSAAAGEEITPEKDEATAAD